MQGSEGSEARIGLNGLADNVAFLSSPVPRTEGRDSAPQVETNEVREVYEQKGWSKEKKARHGKRRRDRNRGRMCGRS